VLSPYKDLVKLTLDLVDSESNSFIDYLSSETTLKELKFTNIDISWESYLKLSEALSSKQLTKLKI
jgi:hypothetical protein